MIFNLSLPVRRIIKLKIRELLLLTDVLCWTAQILELLWKLTKWQTINARKRSRITLLNKNISKHKTHWQLARASSSPIVNLWWCLLYGLWSDPITSLPKTARESNRYDKNTKPLTWSKMGHLPHLLGYFLVRKLRKKTHNQKCKPPSWLLIGRWLWKFLVAGAK